jgi:nucleotide-binding universal stress UspA family protein
MTKILLALDETAAARAAAETAHRLFGDDAEYLAVYVSGDPESTSSMTWGSVYGYPFAAPPVLLDDMARSATEVVDSARASASRHAAEAGVVAEAVGEIGDPAHAISRAAHDHEVDLIVVGHGHRSWLRSLFDPSVTDDLIDNTDVPVMVVPVHDD